MERPDLRRLRPSRRLLTRAAVVLAALVLVPVVVAAGMLRAAYAGAPAKDAVTRGRDALWLGHAWVDGRHTAADLAQLEQRVAGTGIRDLYVHAGPLEHDGTLPTRDYAGARWLIDAVHRDLPGVRVQAWLGDVVVRGGGGGLRPDTSATRDAVVTSARQVLRAGFDGVHLDVGPVRTGDTGYLALLDALHPAVRAGGGVLSVAAQQIDPLPSMHRAAQALGIPKWWSQHYFGQVARRVDQIAVMTYDTALPWESLYGGYVARQTTLALQATPRTTDLLMGLPFYHSDNLSHNSTAETVDAAVRGTRLGLTRQDRGRQAFGVALYVDFAATADDWRAYREGWGDRE